MSIAWWPGTTDSRVASFRLRCLQIVEWLRTHGEPARLYAPGDAAPAVLVLSKRYDAETLDHALALQRRHGTRLVLDLCDNHFFFERDPEGRLQQRADALRRAAAAVDLVVTASSALADIVRDQAPGTRELRVIEDAVELPLHPSRWTRLREWRARGQLRALASALAADGKVAPAGRCVWFGNHGSPGVDGGMTDLRRVQGELERAAAAHGPLSLTVISNNAAKFAEVTRGFGLPTHYLDWHAATFSEALALHGTALIPVNVNPFTICKTANRVLSAFEHGLAVVADSIPSYMPFRDCAVLDDWETGLGVYRHDATARHEDIEAGRRLARDRYALEAVALRWRALAALPQPGNLGQAAP